MSRERPIIMSGESVRAVLDGRKTQTRRVLGFQPAEILTPQNSTAKALASVTRKWAGCRTWFALREPPPASETNQIVGFRCKYGEVGDRLWVRETWANGVALIYRADCVRDDSGEGDGWWRGDMFIPNPVRWRSPIHMPRFASRLTLEITGVRVERVNDISKDDARAEGVCVGHDGFAHIGGTSPRDCFTAAWDALNAKRGYPWETNPWVWVIEFRRTSSGEPAPQ